MNDERQEYVCTFSGEKIPVTFMSRHLLMSLREATLDAIKASHYDVHEFQLSRVRGKLAKHLSILEAKAALADRRAEDNRRLLNEKFELTTDMKMIEASLARLTEQYQAVIAERDAARKLAEDLNKRLLRKRKSRR